jgi:fructose-specific component phosphotransferase system IIB-like protein
MKQYKYFFISDQTKEAIGKVKAYTKHKAMQKAAAKKRLNIEHFLELFNVEEM